MSDSRDLTARAADAATAHQLPVRQSDNLLAQVIAAAKDPSVDAEKMKTLAELVNGQQDREREIEFNRDLNAAIMEMPVITRSGEIIIPANQTKGTPERKQGKFARFEDIDRVCRPILARHNLAIRFELGTEDGQTGAITVRPIISHANGFTERGEAMRVPADTSGSKNAAQAVGSSSQYGKRYAYCAALNIVTEGVDDDGNMGRGTSVSLPFEREQAVLADAHQAFEDGRYIEWFAQQSPKDRGWLVGSGKHVEFGGQPMLAHSANRPIPQGAGPASVGTAKVEDIGPRGGGGAPEATGDAGSGPGAPPIETRTARTPEQMAEDFKARLDGATSARSVIDMQAEPKAAAWLEKMEERYPHLFKDIVDHASEIYARLTAEERDKNG